MKYIKSNTLNSPLAVVDDEDYERCSLLKWWYNHKTGYFWTRHKGVCWYLHQFIHGKAPNGFRVDHINEDKNDNRRTNLQTITHSKNIYKKTGLWKSNITGYKGVSLYRNGTYQAQVHRNGKVTYLGRYKTPIEASLVRTKYLNELS